MRPVIIEFDYIPKIELSILTSPHYMVYSAASEAVVIKVRLCTQLHVVSGHW